MNDEVKDITLNPNEGLEQAIAGLKMDLAKKDAALNQAAKAIQIQQQETAKLRSERDGLEGYARVTEHTAITAAHAAEQERIKLLERDLATALDTANSVEAAKINRMISEAINRAGMFDQGKAKLEDEIEADKRRREAAARQPPPQRPQQAVPQAPVQPADPFESAIAPLPEAQKAWLRTHKDKGYIRPGEQQIVDDKLLSAYYAAKGAGLREDTPQFVAHMDKFLGHNGGDSEPPFAAASERFQEAPPAPARAQQAAPQGQVRQAPPTRQAQAPAAPPGRTASAPRAPKVNLTPAEESAAARMGMTPEEYTEGLRIGIARGKYPANYLQR